MYHDVTFALSDCIRTLRLLHYVRYTYRTTLYLHYVLAVYVLLLT